MCEKIILIETEMILKKLITESKVGRKIGHTVFCEPSTQFRPDWAQNFTNYSPTCDLLLTIAPSYNTEHKPR